MLAALETVWTPAATSHVAPAPAPTTPLPIGLNGPPVDWVPNAQFYALGQSEQVKRRLAHIRALAPNELQILAKEKCIAPNLDTAATIAELIKKINKETVEEDPDGAKVMAFATVEAAADSDTETGEKAVYD